MAVQSFTSSFHPITTVTEHVLYLFKHQSSPKHSIPLSQNTPYQSHLKPLRRFHPLSLPLLPQPYQINIIIIPITRVSLIGVMHIRRTRPIILLMFLWQAKPFVTEGVAPDVALHAGAIISFVVFVIVFLRCELGLFGYWCIGRRRRAGKGRKGEVGVKCVQHSSEQVRALGAVRALVLGFGEREREREMCRLGSGRAAEYVALRRVLSAARVRKVECLMAKSA